MPACQTYTVFIHHARRAAPCNPLSPFKSTEPLMAFIAQYAGSTHASQSNIHSQRSWMAPESTTCTMVTTTSTGIAASPVAISAESKRPATFSG